MCIDDQQPFYANTQNYNPYNNILYLRKLLVPRPFRLELETTLEAAELDLEAADCFPKEKV